MGKAQIYSTFMSVKACSYGSCTRDRILLGVIGEMFGKKPMFESLIQSTADCFVSAREMKDVTGNVNLFSNNGENHAVVVPSFPMAKCQGRSITQCKGCTANESVR